MYKDLTEQCKIKDQTVEDNKVEDALYHEQVLKQLDQMRLREEEEKREYHRIRMEEKRQRDHQLREIMDERR